jgi:hypothetical protein
MMRPGGENPLHLLRALLRECTYLPDAAAREYFHKHILSRYRVYRPRSGRHAKSFQPRSSSAQLHNDFEEDFLRTPRYGRVREKNLNQTARDSLALLQRANSGHTRALTKVLALTYGRTGKRRYELLSPLLAPDTPSDQKAVASLSASLTSTITLQVPPKLEALVKSQIQQRHTDLEKAPIKPLKPRVPKTNIWRRPLPIERVRNIEKHWLQMVLERAMPPLPEEEWERLRRLANGEVRWEGAVQRRIRVPDTGDNDTTPNPERRTLLEDFNKKMLLSTRRPTDSAHYINARFMRRLWARIFPQCPVMRWNAIKESWYFEWGILRSSSGLGPAQLTAFDGVDEGGKVLHQPQVVKGSKLATPFPS